MPNAVRRPEVKMMRNGNRRVESFQNHPTDKRGSDALECSA
jgi:hypothetical protein